MAKGFRGICGNVTMYLIVGLVMSTKQVCWAMAKILFAGEWGGDAWLHFLRIYQVKDCNLYVFKKYYLWSLHFLTGPIRKKFFVPDFVLYCSI